MHYGCNVVTIVVIVNVVIFVVVVVIIQFFVEIKVFALWLSCCNKIIA